MSNLQLVKSEHFGNVQADIYSDKNETFMTAQQLGECLEYSDPIRNVNKIISRNDYLKSPEFSRVVKMTTVDGKQRNVRLFTEDGIYEITFLSKTEKAKEFRAWVRKILKALRCGEAKIVGMTEYQQMMALTRAENARIRKAQILSKMADQYTGTFKQVLQAHATKELTGEFLLPLPEIGQRTYTAEEIGNKIGISKNMVGRIANQNNLKTDKYGMWVNDKVKGFNKEVPSFRYYECVIPAIQKILHQQTAC